jgi:predicted permease
LFLVGLLALLPALAALIGFMFAAPVYTYLFLRRLGQASVLHSIISAVGLIAFLMMIHVIFQAEFADGLLQDYVRLPPPFG